MKTELKQIKSRHDIPSRGPRTSAVRVLIRNQVLSRASFPPLLKENWRGAWGGSVG